MVKLINVTILLFLCLFAICQQKTTLIFGAKVHIGDGTTIDDGAVLIKGEKIEFVGKRGQVDISKYSNYIDAKGKHLYPGFIAPNTKLGLTEIDAVKATRDYREVGDYNPNVRSIIAFNTDSKVITTIKTNGILTAQVAPRGGVFSGTSSIMSLDANNWEDAALKGDDGVYLNWPYYSLKRKKKYYKNVEDIIDFIKEAKSYKNMEDLIDKNIRLEAMRGVLNGTKNLYVRCRKRVQIIDAVTKLKDLGIENIVLVGAYDSYLITDFIKQHSIPIIIRRIHSLPMRQDDDINIPFKLPFILNKAGILFCLENSGDMDAMNTRNLPFLAGTSAAYGLQRDIAIKSITLNAAKILGISDYIGSIEKGKYATMFISKGDALDIRTNDVERAFINGREIDLDNHQKRLYRKYR